MINEPWLNGLTWVDLFRFKGDSSWNRGCQHPTILDTEDIRLWKTGFGQPDLFTETVAKRVDEGIECSRPTISHIYHDDTGCLNFLGFAQENNIR